MRRFPNRTEYRVAKQVAMSAGHLSDLMLVGKQTVKTTDSLAVDVLIYYMNFLKNKVNK